MLLTSSGRARYLMVPGCALFIPAKKSRRRNVMSFTVKINPVDFFVENYDAS